MFAVLSEAFAALEWGDILQLAAGFGVLVGATQLPPVKAGWRRLIVEPREKRMGQIVREELTKRNGGTSLYDVLERLDNRLERMERTQLENADRITRSEARIEMLIEQERAA